MYRKRFAFAVLTLASTLALADPSFVNGITIAGETLDDTGEPGANAGRLGMFSDIYYDAQRKEWWGLSDRGPGGGVLGYATRVQRFSLRFDKHTGAISKFKVLETIGFEDGRNFLSDPTNPDVTRPRAMNGLNPLALNGDASLRGQSFDPEGIVVD